MLLMCIHQLALANQEAKSFCWCLWKQGAAYWSEAKITVISRAESQKEYPEGLFINWLGSLVIDRPNHGPGVDVEAKITVISRAESQKVFPECLFVNWLGSLVIDRPNHGPGVDVEQ
jgi:hypothetical protein